MKMEKETIIAYLAETNTHTIQAVPVFSDWNEKTTIYDFPEVTNGVLVWYTGIGKRFQVCKTFEEAKNWLVEDAEYCLSLVREQLGKAQLNYEIASNWKEEDVI